ncbi:MAG: hypothetical protein GX424_01555 [Clostridiales bacterium]|jgi:hypothetical protein|nr:hypothetical protein [Clostridiales bacterium]
MKKAIIAILLVVLFIIGVLYCSQYVLSQTEGPQKASVSIEPTENEAAQTSDLSPEKPPVALEKASDIKTDSGRYSGQADSNFIEIKISGVPDENAAKVFMLSENLKNEFNDLGLETGDDIKFDYYVNESEQNVLVSIEKIE